MKKLLSLVIVILFGALLARTCLYTVNEREYALVFMLGELKSVVSTPGLHVKRRHRFRMLSIWTNVFSQSTRPQRTWFKPARRRT